MQSHELSSWRRRHWWRGRGRRRRRRRRATVATPCLSSAEASDREARHSCKMVKIAEHWKALKTWIVSVIGVEARTERHRWWDAARDSGQKLPWGEIELFMLGGLWGTTLRSARKHSPARASGERSSRRVIEQTIWAVMLSIVNIAINMIKMVVLMMIML